MMKLPKHEWQQVFISNNDTYKCVKCGKEVTIEYIVNKLLYMSEVCTEIYLRGKLNDTKSSNRSW